MATCKIGNSPIQSAYWGNTEIEKIYYGSNSIYEKAPAGETCTVAGLGSSSPSSVTFTKSTGFTVAGLGIEQITYNGDTFIKIPTMYRKVESVSSDQITSFTISNAKIDNSYEPYTCFVDENGNELPYILIGKYLNTSSSSCVSTTEGDGQKMTPSDLRTYAQSRGIGYLAYDWQIRKLWQDLIISIKGTININTGSGITYDEIGLYWSANRLFVDGIIRKNQNLSDDGAYISYKPSEYESLSGPTASIPSSYIKALYVANDFGGDWCVKKLGYNPAHPFANFCTERVSNSNYNTYYCDGGYWASGNLCLRSMAGYQYANYGAFDEDIMNDWQSTSTVTTRLCYRPIQ